MPQKAKRPVPPCQAATSLPTNIPMQLASYSTDHTKPLSEFQGAFLAARYGLDGARARVVAELVWGRR